MSTQKRGFANSLFETLKEMDGTASNWYFEEASEYPSGLRMYGQHINPNRNPDPSFKPKQYRNEDVIARTLADRLLAIEDVADTKIKPTYSKTNRKGDLLVLFTDGEKLFLEMKPAYPYVWQANARPTSNGFYDGYLHSLKRDNSVAQDFRKLEDLTSADATHAGVLLMGFEISPGFVISDSDITTLKRNGKCDSQRWTERHDAWRDGQQQKYVEKYGRNLECRTRVWLWWREV